MKFNKDKCNAVAPPFQQGGPGSSSAEEDLAAWWEHGQQIKESHYSPCSVTVRAHLEHHLQVGAPQYGKGAGQLERGHPHGWGWRMCPARTGEGAGLLHLEREWLWGEHAEAPSAYEELTEELEPGSSQRCSSGG